jgi:hypothetical protein
MYIKHSFLNTTLRTVLRRSSVVICRNLRICDLRINHQNLRVCDLRSNTPKKFADLRLRNEPKNLRSGDLRT